MQMIIHFIFPYKTAVKGSLPVWEDGGSKGAEGESSMHQ